MLDGAIRGESLAFVVRFPIGILSLALISFQVLSLYWFVSLPVALAGSAFVAVGVYKQRPDAKDVLLGFAPGVVVFTQFAVGLALEDSGFGWNSRIPDALLFAQVVLSLYLLFQWWREPRFVIGLQVLWLMFGLAAWLVAKMAITGTWM